jgi:hypothetical protein
MSRPAERSSRERQATGGVAAPLSRPRRRRDGWRRCPDCGTWLPEQVWRHGSKRCPGYSWLWAMDCYVVIGENLGFYRGDGVLLSITAPGAETLDWDLSLCTVTGPHKCSGELGCQVEPKIAAVWNETAQERFTAAQREAKRRADKALRRHGSKARVSKLCSWWELQKRGVLHAHVVLPVETPEERFWSRAYAEAWRELAPQFWFGFVDGWDKISKKPLQAQQLGRYCAGYAFAGKDKLPLEQAVQDKRLPSRTFHVNRKLTSQTKITMRNARLNRRLDAAWKGLCPWPTLPADELRNALHYRARGRSPDAREGFVQLLWDALPAEARGP